MWQDTFHILCYPSLLQLHQPPLPSVVCSRVTMRQWTLSSSSRSWITCSRSLGISRADIASWQALDERQQRGVFKWCEGHEVRHNPASHHVKAGHTKHIPTWRCVWSVWARLQSAPSCSPSLRKDSDPPVAAWWGGEPPEPASPADWSSPRSFSKHTARCTNNKVQVSFFANQMHESKAQNTLFVNSHNEEPYFKIILSLSGILLGLLHLPRLLSSLQEGRKEEELVNISEDSKCFGFYFKFFC